MKGTKEENAVNISARLIYVVQSWQIIPQKGNC
jgi:hypothetical protein